MEMSTIIVLAIAVFIIIYRIKTWNDVDVLEPKDDIVEEVVEYKIDTPSVTVAKETKKKAAPKKETVAKKTAAKKTPAKKAAAEKAPVEKVAAKKATDKKPAAKKAAPKKTTEKKPPVKKSVAADSVKKSLKADVAKNIALEQAVTNSIKEQSVFEIASQPKKGVSTLITLIESLSKDDRAVGMVYEKSKEGITIIKSFDVKMTNDQFKVATTFAKSVTVKKADMKSDTITATHFFVNEEKTVAVENATITLK